MPADKVSQIEEDFSALSIEQKWPEEKPKTENLTATATIEYEVYIRLLDIMEAEALVFDQAVDVFARYLQYTLQTISEEILNEDKNEVRRWAEQKREYIKQVRDWNHRRLERRRKHRRDGEVIRQKLIRTKQRLKAYITSEVQQEDTEFIPDEFIDCAKDLRKVHKKLEMIQERYSLRKCKFKELRDVIDLSHRRIADIQNSVPAIVSSKEHLKSMTVEMKAKTAQLNERVETAGCKLRLYGDDYVKFAFRVERMSKHNQQVCDDEKCLRTSRL